MEMVRGRCRPWPRLLTGLPNEATGETGFPLLDPAALPGPQKGGGPAGRLLAKSCDAHAQDVGRHVYVIVLPPRLQRLT